MLRFQRAVLAELLGVFVGVLVVVTTAVFAGSTLRLVGKGEGAGFGLLVELIPSLLPMAASLSLPFAWLTATALVINRMVSDHEITALRSAGVHLRTIVVPVLAASVVVSVGSMGWNAWVVPKAQRSVREGIRRYLPTFLASLKDVDRTVTLEQGRFSFDRYAGGVFHDVELDRRDSRGRLELKVVAERVQIRRPPPDAPADSLLFVFSDGWVLRASDAGVPALEYRGPETALQVGRVGRIGASVLFNEFFGTRRYVARPRDLVLPELLYAAERGRIWRGPPGRIGAALHGRLALGCAPLVLGLFAMGMALSLGASGRRVRDFLLSFAPAVVIYFPLFLAGPQLARDGALPPWLAMWQANLIVGAMGAVLLVKAYRR